jgi:ABC-2 type transport system ATP-binding protein
LAATDLSKRFGDVVALDGCSLAAERGRVLGFLGANGAGKTTAMRAVFGLVRLDGGAVTWDGRAIGAAERNRFGYMPEERGLYPRMPVAEQLAYFAQMHGLEPAAAEQAAARWLDELGLGDRAGHPLEDLSHGNQQRVQLAAALVHDPELVLLDEPFSGLDPTGVESMERIVRHQADNGKAIVFSSHQLDLVESLCDDVAILHRGRDVLSGELGALRERSEHRHVVIGFANGTPWTVAEPDVKRTARGDLLLTVSADADPERLLHAARQAGEVRRFEYQPPPLSELFREAVAA